MRQESIAIRNIPLLSLNRHLTKKDIVSDISKVKEIAQWYKAFRKTAGKTVKHIRLIETCSRKSVLLSDVILYMKEK